MDRYVVRYKQRGDTNNVRRAEKLKQIHCEELVWNRTLLACILVHVRSSKQFWEA